MVDVSVQFRPRRQLVARVMTSAPVAANWCASLNFYGSQTKQLEAARDSGRPLRLFGEIRAGLCFGPEMVHPAIASSMARMPHCPRH